MVSMTEATRAGLAHLVRQRYAPVGIAFHKQAVFTAGGGPVFYVRGDEFDAFQTSNLSGAMKSRAVRYWPGARPTRAEPFVTLLTSATESLSEWRHEREWRIPSPAGGEWSWSFEPQDVAFLLHPQGRKGVETAVGGFKDHDGPEHDWVKGRPVLRFDWSAGKFEDDDEVHWP